MAREEKPKVWFPDPPPFPAQLKGKMVEVAWADERVAGSREVEFDGPYVLDDVAVAPGNETWLLLRKEKEPQITDPADQPREYDTPFWCRLSQVWGLQEYQE